jgi:hypothetical protein
LAEFDPVKAVTAAKKNFNASKCLESSLKLSPKNKMRLSLLTSQRLGLDPRAKTLRAKVPSHKLHAHHIKTTYKTHSFTHTGQEEATVTGQ